LQFIMARNTIISWCGINTPQRSQQKNIKYSGAMS
jgi:hypothetical protein